MVLTVTLKLILHSTSYFKQFLQIQAMDKKCFSIKGDAIEARRGENDMEMH